MFTLWLMAKGQGALVGATYGLLLRAETEKKNHRRKRNKDRVRERDPMTDRALKLPRLSFSLSLSPGRCSPCAFFFFFSYSRGHKKNQTRWKRKKKRAHKPENGFLSIHWLCAPGHTTSLKKKKKANCSRKEKKKERWGDCETREEVSVSPFLHVDLKKAMI